VPGKPTVPAISAGINFLPKGKTNLMAACNFSISFSGPPAGIINRAQAAIQDQGGELHGNDMSGAFQLSVLGSDIRGSYNISGQDLNITIDSKPFLIPCGTIRNYLAKYLEGVSV
jgi:hypothetical protein